MYSSQNLYEDLKCSKCNFYLSYFPISITLQGENICGRCDSVSESTIRNSVYEKVASTMKFPCRYQELGCTYLPKWNRVIEHEANCEFREFCCPALENCQWKGKRYNFLHHFQEKHEDLIILQEPQNMVYNLIEDNCKNYLLVITGFIFLIQIKICVSSDKMYHCIRYIGHEEGISQFYCTLKISRNKAQYTDIIPIITKEKCMNISIEKSHVCDISGIQTILKGTDIEFTINVHKKLNTELLNRTKCIICKNFSKPPILNLENNPVCTECAPSGCEIDRDLTCLGLQLLYPCKHKINGCNYFDSLKYIWKHELFQCKLFTCFICNQIFEDTIDSHFKKKHAVLILPLQEMLIIELTDCENWILIISDDKKLLGQYIFDENVLNIMLCSNLSSDLLNTTTCHIKLLDFKEKKTVIKNMIPKSEDAFDWTITLTRQDFLSLVSANRISLVFELYKTVTCEK